jgi:hypothetical protein
MIPAAQTSAIHRLLKTQLRRIGNMGAIVGPAL